jgi:hypothetical protein
MDIALLVPNVHRFFGYDNDPDPDPDPDFDFDFGQARSGCTAKTLRICNTSGSSRISCVSLLALESLAGPIRP